MRRSRFFARLLMLFLFAGPAFAQELTVAAASDLQSVLPEIAARFEKQNNTKLKVSFGSSGNFFAQLQNGAPFDLFLSADWQYSQKLVEMGVAESAAPTGYAGGRIVLWVRKDSTLDLNKGLAAVADPGVKRLAIANPAHAPYGRAAEAALKKAGLWETVSPKLILGENIAQTAQFVESGNADAGILALSLVLAPPMKDEGRYIDVPKDLYGLILQTLVVLKNSQHKFQAYAFKEFLRSHEVQSLFKEDGFITLQEMVKDSNK